MCKKEIIEALNVEFYEADAGWLLFKITIGNQEFDDRFSHVFDPIPELKVWLESMAIGAQQASFWYDNEGQEIKFNFEKITWDREKFYATERNDIKNNAFIIATVSRRQIVHAFYNGLLDFARSEKYSAKEWEIKFMKERLCKLLKIDETTLLTKILELDKDNVEELLFRACPSYWMSIPKDFNKKTIKEKDFSEIVKRIALDEDFSSKKMRVDNSLPLDYDSWDGKSKKELVTELLNEFPNCYYGTKMEGFRSKIIEDFLENDSS